VTAAGDDELGIFRAFPSDPNAGPSRSAVIQDTDGSRGAALVAHHLLVIEPDCVGYLADLPGGFEYERGSIIFSPLDASCHVELLFRRGADLVSVTVPSGCLIEALDASARVDPGGHPDVKEAAADVGTLLAELLKRHGGDDVTELILNYR
jgi:hypothetical protein